MSCHCGGKGTSDKNKVIALEKLLYEIPTEPPDTLGSCCDKCLDSMMYDVKTELGSRQCHSHDNELFEYVDPSTDQYQKIAEHFNRSLKNKVIRIERIRNDKLHSEFVKASSEQNLSSLGGPSYYFHGSRNSNYVSIAKNGFDIKLSNNGALGFGVYFAVNASYSSSFTHGLTQAGHSGVIYNMLYCKVAVMPEDGKVSDIICIRNDRRSYPEYIIYYVN